jgi:hypothetical protein
LRGAAAEIMAFGAVRGAGKRLMGFRKLTGRDLRVHQPLAKASKKAQ